jgi:hypothetical protein
MGRWEGGPYIAKADVEVLEREHPTAVAERLRLRAALVTLRRTLPGVTPQLNSPSTDSPVAALLVRRRRPLSIAKACG